MKSVCGPIKDLKSYYYNSGSGSAVGLERQEFLSIYRLVMNSEKSESKALTVLFYKVGGSNSAMTYCIKMTAATALAVNKLLTSSCFQS